MRTEAYTPDAICNSLGIGVFDPPFKRGEPERLLRLLLCPSFAPEIAITLAELPVDPQRPHKRTAADLKLAISIAAARTQLWTLPAPGIVTVDRETSDIDTRTFDRLDCDFRAALAAAPLSGVTIDGMSVHALLRQSGSTSIRVKGNPTKDSPFGRFVAGIINLSFWASRSARCRNALAEAGRYVEVGLPFESISEEFAERKPSTHMMVLGVAEEQQEFLAALAALAGRKTP